MAKADKDTKTKDNYRPMFPINKLTQRNVKKKNPLHHNLVFVMPE
jgi:hypothetical protein